jgi:hypothetical protein
MKQNVAKKKIKINIIKMLVVLVAIYVATYTWFTTNEEMHVEDLVVATYAINEIDISLDNGVTWNNRVSLDIGDDFLFQKEITGNGVNFFAPKLKTEAGEPTRFIPAVVNDHYLEYKILLRTKLPTVIFLDKKSFVSPAVGTDISDLIGSHGIVRKSPSGDFTRDLIAGAVRVAFIETDFDGVNYIPQSETKMVWAPNKGYEVRQENNSYIAYINSINSQNYDYIAVQSETVFSEARVLNLKDNINASFEEKSAGGDPMLVYIQARSEIPNDDIGSVTIRVWVEGNDREAITPLKGGLFKISLYFVGLLKEFDYTQPNVSANIVSNTIINWGPGLEYSADYGNQWINYVNHTNPVFASGTNVYVRKAETLTVFASNYKILQF